MKRLIAAIFLLILSNQNAEAQTINWETTRNKIIENSYEIQLSQIDIDISKAKILGARAEYYPKLGVYAYNEYNKGLSHENKQTTYIGNEIIYGDNIYQNAVSVGLNYNLFDFGIKGDNLKIAKNENISKKANYYKTLRDIEITAIELYAKALIEYKEILAKTNILEIQKELYSIKTRLNEAGQIDKTKVVTENIRIVELENTIDKLKKEYKNSLKDLSYYLKEEFDVDETVLSDFKDEEDGFVPVNNVLTAGVEETNHLNVEDSPEAKIYDAEIEKKKREHLIAKKQNLPQFTFSTNYYLYGSDTSSYSHSYDNFSQRGLKFRITTYLPIFDGLKNKSERDRLKLEIIRLGIEKEQKIADLKRTFEKIKNDADYSKRQLANNHKMLALIESNIEMLDRLNENLLIDKESYLSQKMQLLNQKLEVEESHINDYMAAYKLTVINKYENEIGQI